MKKTLGLLFILLIAVTLFSACEKDEIEICFHEWEQVASEELVYTPATCRTPATYYSKCSLCGVKGAQFASGEPSSHSYVEAATEDYLITKATCTAKATYYKSCEFCGVANDEVFAAGIADPHAFVKKASVETLKDAKDCEHSNVYYYSCQDCGVLSTSQTFTLGPARPHTDSQGDLMCDYCMKPLEVFDDVSVDNMTDIHHFGKKEGNE